MSAEVEPPEAELQELSLSENELEEQHLQYCSGSSPFCFNKKRGRREVIERTCNDKIYTPIIALNGILALKQRELQKTINVAAYQGIPQNELNKFCSPLDNAWFIIIDDILLRLRLGQKLLSGEELTASDDPSADPNLQTREGLENLNNSAPQINLQTQAINLVQILEKLIQICKLNWEVTEIVPIESHPDYSSCSKDEKPITNDIRCTSVLALNILYKLQNEVLANEQFVKFSEILKKSIQTSEKTVASLLEGKLPAAEEGLPEKPFSEQITEIFSLLTSFFQMCKHLFNRKDSLYGGSLYNEIESTITQLTNSLNIFFSPPPNLLGGRRCKRRMVTNKKKCKKKISYKTCSSYKKQAQFNKQKYNKKNFYTKRFPKKKSMRRYKKTLKGGLGGVLDKIWSGIKWVARGVSAVLVKAPVTISFFFGGFLSSFGWVPAGTLVKLITYILELIFTKKHDLYLDEKETNDAMKLAIRELFFSNPFFFSMFLIWGYRYDFTFNRLVRTKSKALEYAVNYRCGLVANHAPEGQEKNTKYECKKILTYILANYKFTEVNDDAAFLKKLYGQFKRIDERKLDDFFENARNITDSLKFPSNIEETLDEVYTQGVLFNWIFENTNIRASYGAINNNFR
jgi:hypothetical protein